MALINNRGARIGVALIILILVSTAAFIYSRPKVEVKEFSLESPVPISQENEAESLATSTEMSNAGDGNNQTAEFSATSSAALSIINNAALDNGQKEMLLGQEMAVKKALDYVNKNMLGAGIVATYKDIKDENGLYTFKLVVEGKDYGAYVAKNGKLFFAEGIPQPIDLDKPLDSSSGQALVKTDRPDVKLFVMSYCPYGLQAQKMYLPVYNLLKNKANMGIYFVNYAMHGKKEIDENLRQYCIQKEQLAKYATYLKCFIESQVDDDGLGNYSGCLTQAGIDQPKLEICVVAADKQFNVNADYNDKNTWISGNYPKFRVNDDLNEKYSVQGSPTIIVNEQDASDSLTNRTPEAFKKTICAAFKVAPTECKKTLSDESPSTGFGSGTSQSSGGGCGG